VRVRLQHKLQPLETEADSLVIEDQQGNPIFVALQLPEAVIYADAGEPDFHSLLQQLGIKKTVAVTEIRPKPVQNVIWKP
jgi:hypothetical protein